MYETIPFDIASLLLFTMPGFFLLWSVGYRAKSDFVFFMFSMFWGIVLMMIFIYKISFVKWMTPLLNNPYAGAVVFSILAYALGSVIKWIKPKFK